MVSWPSGLGIGLQNRVQRFESARDLQNPLKQSGGFCFYFLSCRRFKEPDEKHPFFILFIFRFLFLYSRMYKPIRRHLSCRYFSHYAFFWKGSIHRKWHHSNWAYRNDRGDNLKHLCWFHLFRYVGEQKSVTNDFSYIDRRKPGIVTFFWIWAKWVCQKRLRICISPYM